MFWKRYSGDSSAFTVKNHCSMVVSQSFKTHSLSGKHKNFLCYWNTLNELNAMVKKETKAKVSLEHAFQKYVGSTQVGVLSYSWQPWSTCAWVTVKWKIWTGWHSLILVKQTQKWLNDMDVLLSIGDFVVDLPDVTLKISGHTFLNWISSK